MNKAACEIIMQSVDIEMAAEFYGISINRYHKALCVFHDDKRPSMRFAFNRFRCFSCEAKGSIIDLVSKLFSLSTPEAIKKINSDFNLGMDLKSSAVRDSKILKERREKEQCKKKRERLEKNVFDYYVDKKRNLEALLRAVDPCGRMEAAYFEAIGELSYVEYVLDILVGWDEEEKECVYQTMKENLHEDKSD